MDLSGRVLKTLRNRARTKAKLFAQLAAVYEDEAAMWDDEKEVEKGREKKKIKII